MKEMIRIPFNRPAVTGKELSYISKAVSSGQISGDGFFSKKCQEFFEEEYGFNKTLLTTSCTDALEMCALLLDINPGDEIIVPSFTFVSTANAFVTHKAKIIFADSHYYSPNICEEGIESLITARTKAIVVVHYAGIACDMDLIMKVANRHGLAVVEDAAQAVDSFYNGAPLGSLGTFGTFSFHETKNITCGEGGLIAINDPQYVARAEILREKGTNRSAFFRGQVDKYTWVDIGSSFLPSELNAAYLFAQLESITSIQNHRKSLWNLYYERLYFLKEKYSLGLPEIPNYATNNAHMFYVVCDNLRQRNHLLALLKEQGIHAVFHYQSLHLSPYFRTQHDGRVLQNCERFSDCLLRLPLYYGLRHEDVERICDSLIDAIRVG